MLGKIMNKSAKKRLETLEMIGHLPKEKKINFKNYKFNIKKIRKILNSFQKK